MAGSYKHCTNHVGEFIGSDFHNLIENLGDAYEACEMMHWMIRYLAEGDPSRISQAEREYFNHKRVGV